MEDKILIWKLKRGDRNALRRIYEKYRIDLLRLATALLNRNNDAEDVVHDVFINFVRSADQFHLTGSLKGYLATCVANMARNANLASQKCQTAGLNGFEPTASQHRRPDQWIMRTEELRRINDALAQLPYEQREVVGLHLQGGLKFREIARLQGVSIKTVQSRYRYGLDKLRPILR